MGHLNMPDIQKLVGKEMAVGIDLKGKEYTLKTCEKLVVLGKQPRKPFPAISGRRSNRALQLIHTDVCGPIEPNAWDGSKYFVTFIDDYTHFTTVYILEKKSDVLNMFKQYAAMAETHFQTKIVECSMGENIRKYVRM